MCATLNHDLLAPPHASPDLAPPPPRPVLVWGHGPEAHAVQRRLQNTLGPAVQVRLHTGAWDAQPPLATDVALLLWPGDGALQALPEVVRTLLERPGQATPPEVLLRSASPLPEALRDALWALGVMDRQHDQPLASAALVDAVAVALRHYACKSTLSDIPALSGHFAKAKTLHDLAQLSLRAVHERLLPVRGGLFGYLGRPDDPRSHCDLSPRLIAGSGCQTIRGCIRLEHLPDTAAQHLVRSALEHGCSQFGAHGAAAYLRSSGGFVACLYFTLERALHPWEKAVLKMIGEVVATAIDQSQLAQQLLRTQHATISTLSALAEYRDVDTGEHVARVARMTTEIAQMLAQEDPRIDERFLEHVGLASILHDTGKIAIPDDILLKPGPLLAAERKAMEQHVVFGYDILTKAAQRIDDGQLLTMAAEIARYHHERFDGTGYPHALQGEDIPLPARIVALVDVYDALTSVRPYKLPWPHEKAVELIRQESGRHFDPKVVEAFLRLDAVKKAARYIEWTDNMSVNHPDLDFDHQRLIEIVNRLWVADNQGNRQIIEFVLDDLVNYTEFHFAREEQLLAQAGFADLERHAKIHEGICRRLEEIRWEYFQGIRDELRSSLLEFVTVWLNKHILEEDRQYSSYFAAARISPELKKEISR